MDKVRIGIVGLGNMGTEHAEKFLTQKIENAILAAVCDIDESRLISYKDKNIAIFKSYSDMFKSGLIDAVIIATPHYSHTEIGICAFNAGLHVFCEKPIGVYTKQVNELNSVARIHNKQVFSSGFCLRTMNINKKIREIIQNDQLGKIKRINWIATNYYRSQSYYDSSNWRATWVGEGGGILMNQAPHTLDLLWYFFGVLPSRVFSKCYFGKWHDIEVEDDVTAIFEYLNGAIATLTVSTADAPGTDRLEILGDKGRLLLENGKLIKSTLKIPEREFNKTYKGGFGYPEYTTEEIKIEPDEKQIHVAILQNFVNAILGKEELIADGQEGIKSLQLANAILLSTWFNKWIDLPVDENIFFDELTKRVKKSKAKTGQDIKLNITDSLKK